MSHLTQNGSNCTHSPLPISLLVLRTPFMAIFQVKLGLLVGFIYPHDPEEGIQK